MIPGVKNLRDEDVKLHNLGKMDMMRGEEAETLGMIYALQISKPTVLVLPGSHTKFVAIGDNGSILGCITSMTGELLQLMTQYSVVGDAVRNQFVNCPSMQFLLAGYQAARECDSYGRAAFLTRICSQFVTKDPEKCASFLLGVTLENDIQAISNSELLVGSGIVDAVIAGKEPLASSLKYLLEQEGLFDNVQLYQGEKEVPVSGLGVWAIHDIRKGK